MVRSILVKFTLYRVYDSLGGSIPASQVFGFQNMYLYLKIRNYVIIKLVSLLVSTTVLNYVSKYF